MKKCLVCEKGSLEKVEDMVIELEGYIFVARGERCTHCKEEFPYEEETKRMINTAKKLGIWPEPLKLYRHLSRSGGGLVFRVPVDLERQLNLTEKTGIEITKVGNKLVIGVEK